MATVAIIDDDRLVCDILNMRLDSDSDFECVGIASSPAEARKLVGKCTPDLIILDIMLGGTTDPIDLAADLIKASPHSQVIVCTAWSDNPSLDREQEFRQKFRASRSGVTDWVSKSRGVNEIIERLRLAVQRPRAAQGPLSPIEDALGSYLRSAETIFDGVTFRGGDTELTPTELRVAAVVARGLEADVTVEEICRLARLMPGTVRAHLKSIYAKWNVHLQPAFVAEARRRGLMGD